MNTNTVDTYECYHGTSLENAQKIQTEGQFKSSNKDNEWAGTGVYFFIDKPGSKSCAANKNAAKWAKLFKKYPHPCVMKATVQIEQAQILDFDQEDMRDLFHQCRTRYFQEACRRAQAQGIALKETYLEPGKLDCAAIDYMCKLFHFHAVIKPVYISCLSDVYRNGGHRYPKSFTPNCTMLCLKDQNLICDLDIVV
ncbi:MAG: hypothetical protein HFE97_10950 [Oscillospiraceae bacterium]|nr:hypothetical protein [Oscillospiraceae bacterium]